MSFTCNAVNLLNSNRKEFEKLINIWKYKYISK